MSLRPNTGTTKLGERYWTVTQMLNLTQVTIPVRGQAKAKLAWTELGAVVAWVANASNFFFPLATNFSCFSLKNTFVGS